MQVGGGLDVTAQGLLSVLTATLEQNGIMRPDGTTCTVENGVLKVLQQTSDYMEEWRKSWIGVPRYWRSTTLPANHCWANGDAILFADWPELKAVYDAGGFEGMLLPWDASSEQQAANLGKWRPNALNPTGLYTPALSGQFFRNWGLESEEEAGIFNQPGLPNITGGWTGDLSSGHYGAFSSSQMSSFGIGNGSYGKMKTTMDASRCSPIYGRATTVMPSSINQPIILYLGRPA